MSKLKNYAASVLLSVASAIVVVALALSGSPTNLGGTPGDLPTRVATSSELALVANTVLDAFVATSSLQDCSGREITTTASPVKVGFGTGPNPSDNGTSTVSASYGVSQAASTTVLYEAENYGCAPASIFPFASGSLSVTIFR